MSNNYRKSRCCKTCAHQRSKECWYGGSYNHQVCDDDTCDNHSWDKPHGIHPNRSIWICNLCRNHTTELPCYLVRIGTAVPPIACVDGLCKPEWERIVRYNDIINILKGQ